MGPCSPHRGFTFYPKSEGKSLNRWVGSDLWPEVTVPQRLGVREKEYKAVLSVCYDRSVLNQHYPVLYPLVTYSYWAVGLCLVQLWD